MFFKCFVKWYGTILYQNLVKMPTPSEVYDMGREYRNAGFPGALGSMDCVHTRLWSVAAQNRVTATGKEKYASRVYEVIVNHRGIILSVASGFHGSVSDKTICRFDESIMLIQSGYYKDCTYEVYTSEDTQGHVLPHSFPYHHIIIITLKKVSKFNISQIS